MYDSLLAALFMGVVPIGGMQEPVQAELAAMLSVAPPSVEERFRDEEVIQVLRTQISASGVLIVDARSGQSLYAFASRETRPMASLTKLMTALLIAEHHDMDEWVTVPHAAGSIPGEVAYLPPGEEFKVGDLLSALLIGSANDAAITLAIYHSGTVSAFVEEMNQRARELGLTQTAFDNPVGFDAVHQYSTPQDLIWLSMFVQKNTYIQKRMSIRGARIYSRSGEEIYVTHTHALLHADTAVLAGKTGTTDAAKQCLLSLVEGENKKQYLVLLLHSSDRYADMRTILRFLVL